MAANVGQSLGFFGLPDRGKIVYSVMAALVAIHVSIIFRAYHTEAMRKYQKYFCYQAVRRLASRSLAALKTAWATEGSTPNADSRMTKLVCDRLDMQYVQKAKNMWWRFGLLYCFIDFTILILVLNGIAWTRDLSIDTGVLVQHAIMVFFTACPELTTPKSTLVAHSAMMATMICMVVVGFTHERFEMIGPIYLVTQVILSFHQRYMHITVFWNFVYHCTVSYCFASTASACEGRMQSREFAVREFVIFIAHMIIAWYWQSSQFRDCEMFFRVHFATKEHVAFTSLLNATYDVVIKLDDRLCIQEGGDKLSALLLYDSGKKLNGTDFKTCIPLGDDLHHFTSITSEGASQTNGLANVFHIHLRDRCGNLLAVELFHASLLGMDEQVTHVIGIREESVESLGVRQRSVPEYPKAFDTGLTGTSVKFCALEPRCPIVEASAEFGALFGPCLKGQSLREWIKSADFWEGFQVLVNTACYSDTDVDGNIKIHGQEKIKQRIKIRSPHSISVGIEYEVTCIVDVSFEELGGAEQDLADDDEDESLTVIGTFVFSDVVEHKKARSKKTCNRMKREWSSSGKRSTCSSDLMESISEE